MTCFLDLCVSSHLRPFSGTGAGVESPFSSPNFFIHPLVFSTNCCARSSTTIAVSVAIIAIHFVSGLYLHFNVESPTLECDIQRCPTDNDVIINYRLEDESVHESLGGNYDVSKARIAPTSYRPTELRSGEHTDSRQTPMLYPTDFDTADDSESQYETLRSQKKKQRWWRFGSGRNQ